MSRLWGIVGVALLGAILGACAQVSGLGEYGTGASAADGGVTDATTPDGRDAGQPSSPDAADGGRRDASASPDGAANEAGLSDATADANASGEASPMSDAEDEDDAGTDSEAADAGADDAAPDAPACPASTPTLCNGTCVDEQTNVASCGGCGPTFACAAAQSCSSGQCLGCGTACPVSVASAYACAAGGCNTASGACTAGGQGCYCTKNSACKSGLCVKITGQNDVSCGASCTGTGAADGFGCTLGAPGIPSACVGSAFGYTPSNFAPASYTPPGTGTTINCNTTYSSSTHSFTGWCSGQTAPTVVPGVAQSSGPAVDILVFLSLTLDSGDTLTLTGGNPVILAVYGAASISGTIDASAQGTTPGAGATACSVGAAGGGASGPAYTAGTDGGASGGGGGGLAVAGGAGDFSTYEGSGGNPATGTDFIGAAGGSAHGSSTVVPLVGGCPGGTGAAGSNNSGGAAGAGGGGVQLSVAGAISGSGTIKTNGSAGTTGPSTVVLHENGAGGGGGGGAGDILIESAGSNSLTLSANGGAGGTGGAGYGADTTSVNTWPGFPGGTGGTHGGGSTAAPTNGGPPGERGQSYTGGGGGGGGAYGWTHTNTGAAGPLYACTTSLSPAPVCNAAHTACLCAADSDCSSGKCANTSGQCTGSCTGSGATDGTSCQALQSAAAAWSCALGSCSTATAPGSICGGAGVACFCTADGQCASGQCGDWAGCAAGACSGSGTTDGMHCVP